MKQIWRFLAAYALPQWPRVTAAIVAAVLTSVLLSLNFLTLVPLLKVMVEGEGIHAWLDRKICQARYAIELRLASPTEVSSGLASINALIVSSVDPTGPSGLGHMDQVVGLADQNEPASGPRLLETIAAYPSQQVAVIITKAPDHQRTAVVVLEDLGAIQTAKGLATFQRRAYTALLQKARAMARLVPAGPENIFKAVLVILIGIFLVTLARCLAKFYQNYLGEKIVHVAAMRIKNDIFAHMTYMPVAAFDQHRPSDYVSRVIRDANEIGYCLNVLFGPALREPLNTICFVGAAMLLNWQLTLIFLAGGPVVITLIAKFGRRMRRASHRSLQAASQMLAKLNQTLAGLKIVKVCNRQEYEQAKFTAISLTHLKEQLKMAKIQAAASPAMEVIGMAAACLAIAIGVHWVNRIGSSEFLTLLVLLGAAADAARKSSDLWPKLQRSVAPAQRLMSLFHQPKETEGPGAITIKRASGRIEFQDVYFAYAGTSRPALAGINLVIEPGQTVAIVGANGSGKTTLAHLIPRFYEPQRGRVMIDGADVRDITLASLREQIGLVTQQVITFPDTIANNIRYGKPDASDQEVVAAAQQAFADEFIRQLPDGYQTMIGEGNCGLSGGQLQRIAIARAILKDPPILIFDEATSQIDADSEAKIHSAIESMLGHRTTIIIAHRFSTVIGADRIVVLHEGRLVDQGSHHQLVESCPIYKALYQTQLVH
ncbi:MAG: ABC transporter ATP-binding protein [Sedimentisphaerales bacterium]|nr:ABC transporter ATP-binding protein [Sedimentisphaerales bacterium]